MEKVGKKTQGCNTQTTATQLFCPQKLLDSIHMRSASREAKLTITEQFVLGGRGFKYSLSPPELRRKREQPARPEVDVQTDRAGRGDASKQCLHTSASRDLRGSGTPKKHRGKRKTGGWGRRKRAGVRSRGATRGN